MAEWRAALADVLARIEADDLRFHYPIRHGTMRLGVYTPRDRDLQTPHDQDELYIVVGGAGTLVRGDERVAVKAGDALFMPAGMPHRFEGFGDDFVAWVVFWGPEGGEAD